MKSPEQIVYLCSMRYMDHAGMIIEVPPPQMTPLFSKMSRNRREKSAKLKKAVSRNFWVPSEEIRIPVN